MIKKTYGRTRRQRIPEMATDYEERRTNPDREFRLKLSVNIGQKGQI